MPVRLFVVLVCMAALLGCGETPPVDTSNVFTKTTMDVTITPQANGLIRVTVDSTVIAPSKSAALRAVAAELEKQAQALDPRPIGAPEAIHGSEVVPSAEKPQPATTAK